MNRRAQHQPGSVRDERDAEVLQGHAERHAGRHGNSEQQHGLEQQGKTELEAQRADDEAHFAMNRTRRLSQHNA
ncbi:MAG: hypothetical protein IT531_20815 [Burkholderiales bacterium]|nr:hypothetical protein [Burkholderiales bacterium]